MIRQRLWRLFSIVLWTNVALLSGCREPKGPKKGELLIWHWLTDREFRRTVRDSFIGSDAGKAAGAAVCALTTTVRVRWPTQPAPFPMPNAAPPPRTAATTVTAARLPARIDSL